jgi:hypothetical protein
LWTGVGLPSLAGALAPVLVPAPAVLPRARVRPPGVSDLVPLRRAAARAPALPVRAPWRADPVRAAAAAASPTPQRRSSHPAARKPLPRLPLVLWSADAPPAGGAGAGSSGSSGGGGAGVAAAAALYLLLQVPAGVLVRRRRTGHAPRSRVDDVPTPPG